MAHIWILAILVIVVILILFIWYRTQTQPFVVDGMIVNVVAEMDNRDGAIRCVKECNERMLRLLEHLRSKYKIGATDTECGPECRAAAIRKREIREIIRHLLMDFNYEAIHENKPRRGSTNVAYSIDKGRKIMLCLRGVDDPTQIVDIDVLMFVVLHEAAHIANYNEWGHGPRFWSIFKYLLLEADALGVYKPTDYARHPVNYCGFHLDHNPLFDSRFLPIVPLI